MADVVERIEERVQTREVRAVEPPRVVAPEPARSTLSREELARLHAETGYLSVSRRRKALRGLSKADHEALEAFAREDFAKRKRDVAIAGGADAYAELMMNKAAKERPWTVPEQILGKRSVPRLLS